MTSAIMAASAVAHRSYLRRGGDSIMVTLIRAPVAHGNIISDSQFPDVEFKCIVP